MTDPTNIVIVGGGLAGAKAVEGLRARGYDGDITLFGAEPHLPYERPPLSKGLLLGSEEPDSVFVHDQAWYDEQRVDLRTGTEVTGLDLDRRRVTAGGTETAFDRLLLTTGSAPRRLAIADASGVPVAYLRTLDDSLALKEQLGRRLVLIGGGWIGLEVAAAARAAGGEVTVVESLELPLLAALGSRVATTFAALHREHGVDLRLGATVEAIEPDGDGAAVRLADGSTVTGDLVVVGIGASARDDLASAAGLPCDRGVLVDGRLEAVPGVFAAGDVAQHDHPVLGRRIRVEHWDTAIEQGTHVAGALLGEEAPYTRLPYFFTDQYDLGMEYVGNVGPEGFDDVVVRGDEEGRVFSAFWLGGGRVLAGMHVNDWDAIDPIRALVGQRVDPARLRDEKVALAEVLD
jgi:NADPH-dependent 2,4-dienoyl-CoA reductase/sulfur reductase-like enzyme